MGGPKHWRIDEEGNVTNFALQDLRQDLLLRIRTNNLYTLEECKLFLSEILKWMNRTAKADFAEIMWLSGLRDKYARGEPVDLEVVGAEIPAIDFDFPRPPENSTAALKQTLQAMIASLVDELNKALVRVIDVVLFERRDRLLVAACLMDDVRTAVANAVSSVP